MIRIGDWRPGATSPAMLAVELLTAGQAALRGLSYLRGDVPPYGPVALVEATAPPTTWGWLFLGSALAVLLGLAGRWAAVLVAAHLLLGAVYAGLGIAVLRLTSGPASLLGLAGVAAAALGAYLVACPRVRSAPARFLLGVPLLAGSGVALSIALGSEYATGTGFVIGGAVQAALAGGVLLAAARDRARQLLEEESHA